MKKIYIKLFVLLMLGTLMTGCRDIDITRSRPDYSIGVVFKANNSPYWIEMESGMEKAAADYQVDLKLLYPSGESETWEQERLVTDLLNSDIDLLMVSPCNCFRTEWIVNAAKEKGIIFQTIDDHAMTTGVPHIGSDNRQIGQDAAQYFAETLPEGASILLLLGPDDQMSSMDRLNGIQSNLSRSMRVQKVVFTNMTEETAYQAVLESTEKIDGVFCHNIVLARGAIAALEEKGWDAQIISVDTGEDAKRVLQQGKVDAIFQQNGYEIGYEAIKNAVEALEKDILPKNISFQSELLTRDSGEE